MFADLNSAVVYQVKNKTPMIQNISTNKGTKTNIHFELPIQTTYGLYPIPIEMIF